MVFAVPRKTLIQYTASTIITSNLRWELGTNSTEVVQETMQFQHTEQWTHYGNRIYEFRFWV